MEHSHEDAELLCVDTWVGTAELRRDLPDLTALCWDAVQKNLYKFKNRCTLIRKDSLDGLQIIKDHGLQPDLFYVDSDHAYHHVRKELYYIINNFPNATIVGDDYYLSDVQTAVHDIVYEYKKPAIIHPEFYVINWKN
jgi:hypothetical protein